MTGQGRRLVLASAHEIDDLDLVAVLEHGLIEEAALEHHEVVLDGYSAGVDSQLNQQGADRHRTIQIERIAVETNGENCARAAHMPRFPQRTAHLWQRQGGAGILTSSPGI